MIIYETAIQTETAKYPTELDFQRILTARHPQPSWKQQQKLKWLESGLGGEQKVLECLEEDGKEHWIAIQNLWLSYNEHPFEIDMVLIINQCLYLLEIKNYKGKLTYENGITDIDNGTLEYDPVHQARKALIRTRKIFNTFPLPIQIKSVLIFIGEKNKVILKSPIEDITVLQLTDLYAFIQDLIEAETKLPAQKCSSEEIINHLEKYEIMHPYLPASLPKSQLQPLRTGIRCSRCGSFDLVQERPYLKCKCGLHEPREEAIVRTACEYATLAYNEKFRTGEIKHYIGGKASDGYLRKILKKHFKQFFKQRFTEYEIAGLPYYKTHQLYTFDSSVIFNTERGKPEVYILK